MKAGYRKRSTDTLSSCSCLGFADLIFDLWFSWYLSHMFCLQTWTRPLGTPWMPTKQPRCTRTSPSNCCRTTSQLAAFLSITSLVYVKQHAVFEFTYHHCQLSPFTVLSSWIPLLFPQWTDGPPPVQIQAQNGPTTSLASLLWGTFCVTYDISWYTVTCNRPL